MIERIAEWVNADPTLVRRGRWTNADMLVEVGDDQRIVEIREGRMSVKAPGYPSTNWNFAIRGTADGWAEYWKPRPKPRHHDFMALIREGKMRFEGDLDLLMANLLYLKLAFEKPRREGRS